MTKRRTERMARGSPVAVYLSELSEGSRRTMRFALRSACEFLGGTDPETFPWHEVRVDQVAALRADLASRLAQTGRRRPEAVARERSLERLVRRSADRCGAAGGPDERRGSVAVLDAAIRAPDSVRASRTVIARRPARAPGEPLVLVGYEHAETPALRKKSLDRLVSMHKRWGTSAYERWGQFAEAEIWRLKTVEAEGPMSGQVR